MRIVKGRGSNRSVIEFPTGAIVANDKSGVAPAMIANVCDMLGIPS